MTALFADSHTMQLSEALGGIGELKNSIGDMMHRIHFTDVVNTQGEVAGNRSGCASPCYICTLPIEVFGGSQWQRGTLKMARGLH
jgi:hypothetical protein